MLGALATLQDLSVANTAAGDVSLAAWGALTALTRLNLDSTAVTDRFAACALGRGLSGFRVFKKQAVLWTGMLCKIFWAHGRIAGRLGHTCRPRTLRFGLHRQNLQVRCARPLAAGRRVVDTLGLLISTQISADGAPVHSAGIPC